MNTTNNHNNFKRYKDKIWNCVPCRMVLIIAAILLGLFLSVLIFVNPVLNNFLKPKIEERINSNEGQHLSLNNLSYNIFNNSLSSEMSQYNFVSRSEGETDSIEIKASQISLTGISWFEIINEEYNFSGVYLKDPVINLFQKSIPQKETEDNTNENNGEDFSEDFKLGVLSIENGTFIRTSFGSEETQQDSLINFSLKMNNIDLTSSDKDSSKLKYAESVELNIEKIRSIFNESGYKLEIDSIRLSSIDSIANIGSISYKLFISEEKYFAKDKYRKDKNLIEMPGISFSGIDFSQLVWNNLFYAEKVIADNFVLEILTNKRKPVRPGDYPQMPHEFIRETEFKFAIREMRFSGGKIVVEELWPHSNQPSHLDFTRIDGVIYNLSSTPERQSESYPMIIKASANLADAGRLHVEMELPLITDVLKFSYEGSLEKMEAMHINSHLRIADLSEITSGYIETVTFSASAEGQTGRANVVPIYRSLKIKTLDEDLDNSLIEKIKTLIANTVVIRENNPDEENQIKSGDTTYQKQPGDTILDVVWLTLRKALGEVVGF
jgi:hypothetical protein